LPNELIIMVARPRFSKERRPFLICACLFVFISQLTFSDVHRSTFSTHFHALVPNAALLCQFPESAPNKNEGRKPQVYQMLPNLAPNRHSQRGKENSRPEATLLIDAY